MGDWKPFHQVVARSLERTMRWFGLEYREGDVEAVYACLVLAQNRIRDAVLDTRRQEQSAEQPAPAF